MRRQIIRIVNPDRGLPSTLTGKQYLSWRVEVLNQSDRGFAILVCAYVEEAMKTTLESIFVESESKYARSLQSRSSRMLLRALGIIGTGMAKDIAQLAKIRNEFAHNILESEGSSASLSFSSPKIDRWCKELIVPKIFLIEPHQGTGGIHFHPKVNPHTEDEFTRQINEMPNRDRFFWTAHTICILLKMEASDGGRLPPARQHANYDEDWNKTGPSRSDSD